MTSAIINEALRPHKDQFVSLGGLRRLDEKWKYARKEVGEFTQQSWQRQPTLGRIQMREMHHRVVQAAPIGQCGLDLSGFADRYHLVFLIVQDRYHRRMHVLQIP